MITAIFFDLDDTLYDKSSYLSSAFIEAAGYIEKHYDIEADHVTEDLWRIYHDRGSMYGGLFDDLADTLKIKDERIVAKLVEIFHEAPVDSLKLFEDASRFLEEYRDRFYFGLITNGNSFMQGRKVDSLGLSDKMKTRIFTDRIGHPKPSSKPYEYALKASNKRGEECVYVGDNPAIDFPGAKKAGFKTVWLLRGEFKNAECRDASFIDERMKDFNELYDIIYKFDNS